MPLVAKRLLIVAGKSAPGIDTLPGGVRELIDGADEILVVTPALPNRLDWLASATDKAREQADERLSAIMDQLADTDTMSAVRSAPTTRCLRLRTRFGSSSPITFWSPCDQTKRRAGKNAVCSRSCVNASACRRRCLRFGRVRSGLAAGADHSSESRRITARSEWPICRYFMPEEGLEPPTRGS